MKRFQVSNNNNNNHNYYDDNDPSDIVNTVYQLIRRMKRVNNDNNNKCEMNNDICQVVKNTNKNNQLTIPRSNINDSRFIINTD